MTRTRALWLAIAFAGAVPPHALHAQAADGGSCRNGAFASMQDGFALAKVAGAGRLYFLGDMDGCPRDERACHAGGYVVPGDTVLTGRALGAFRCAFYPNDAGGSAGWVRADRLQPQPVPAAPPPHAWLGKWKDGDNALVLRREGGMLAAKGEAYWPSADPPQEQFPGGPNVGGLEGKAAPAGNRAVFVDGECRVTATLVGSLLVVADNGGCGGMNVRFDGVYRRR
ncbi:hypothetical protein [Fulvimonas soli]|uniref:Uncharacterized protein n=1 Tax=Fulvimonas soli TaxID=155197 RepID=A0A316I5Q1_9GAMM|nr:hypothetical protein [Fulvimonas soli]PWK87780.1 hypothetical protein C7456_106273 [Fulvimonas soli]TNY26508.1 hypothetical protein BV497_08170 [Fulvimonas soli]